MARLTLKAIEANIETLAHQESYDREFLYSLLIAYGKPKSSISRLRNGSLNVATEPDHEVAQKGVVYLSELTNATEADLLEVGERLKSAAHVIRYAPRFILVTDYVTMLAWDTKTGENVVFPIEKIDEHFTFFLPWAGMEKTQYVADSHADIKAAEQMGQLFDELLKANPDVLNDETKRHGLNVFFTRLLFCYFAEDTGIFEENQFTNAVGSQTLDDGSDVQEFLTNLFLALDTSNPNDKPIHLATFPYVNGHLFSMEQTIIVPSFTKKARSMLLGLGSLIWREINPDIFGSMFQAIVTPGKRSNLGQHYTSVPNILKTIEPLFLDDLRNQFDESYNSVTKLQHLLQRIADISIFDPACGSGNFLVIAYKELRRLEHAVLERLADLDTTHNFLFTDSVVNIEHFYGIEIDDFATEVAILSLWIAKHQMNREFHDKFGTDIPLIPLRQMGSVHAGNATRMDWNKVCPNDGISEIYLIGNPPYVGSSMQSKEQKNDYHFVFGERPYSKRLDYISLWIIKGADYISNTRAQLAFITTNSVTQGEHIGILFPLIFKLGLEIGYAYTSFKWENNAKHNAGVTVVVLNLRFACSKPKYLYHDDLRTQVKNIGPYLTDGTTIFVKPHRNPIITYLPIMSKGNQATDGGNLILNPHERESLISTTPRVEKFIRRYMGASEFINGKDRYCIWVTESNRDEAFGIPSFTDRFEKVKELRLGSRDIGARKLAETPWRFREQRIGNAIIVPSVSSERREYVPIGYLGPDTVISNLAFAVYDAEPWLFAILTSRMHMAWLRAVGGKMKTDYRYSNTLVYNTFPVPPLDDAQKEALTERALRVLDVREYHCEYTLAELYDPEKMPANLRQAHAALDAEVDRLYRNRQFESDEERLSLLFDLYQKLIDEEAARTEAQKSSAKTHRKGKAQ